MKNCTTINKLLSNKWIRNGIAFVVWVSLWAVLASVVQKEVLLPSPLSVVQRLVGLAGTPAYWLSIGASLLRVLVGFLAGCAVAVLLSILCFRFVLLEAVFSPLLSVIRSVPVASFIILALVWIGRMQVPSFSAFLMTLPIVTGNCLAGFRDADTQLLEVCDVFALPFAKRLELVYVPSVAPFFRSAARTALGMSWKAGIAAEILASVSASIGGGIYEGKLYLETPSLFAWTVTVIAITMLFEFLLDRLPVFHPECGTREAK